MITTRNNQTSVSVFVKPVLSLKDTEKTVKILTESGFPLKKLWMKKGLKIRLFRAKIEDFSTCLRWFYSDTLSRRTAFSVKKLWMFGKSIKILRDSRVHMFCVYASTSIAYFGCFGAFLSGFDGFSSIFPLDLQKNSGQTLCRENSYNFSLGCRNSLIFRI